MKSNKKNRNNEHGAGLVEYSLLVALISIISLAGIEAFSTSVQDSYLESATQIENAGKMQQSQCVWDSQQNKIVCS